jgi:bifunctional DNA-binding transcriptional regulator/antitoxin component of YhaV-PrlF toxin-antitoxin module
MAKEITKIGKAYRVVIPPKTRKALSVKVGDYVGFEPKGDTATLMAVEIVKKISKDKE